MSQTVSPATGRIYGLARVARVWRRSRATVRGGSGNSDRPISGVSA